MHTGREPNSRNVKHTPPPPPKRRMIRAMVRSATVRATNQALPRFAVRSPLSRARIDGSDCRQHFFSFAPEPVQRLRFVALKSERVNDGRLERNPGVAQANAQDIDCSTSRVAETGQA